MLSQPAEFDVVEGVKGVELSGHQRDGPLCRREPATGNETLFADREVARLIAELRDSRGMIALHRTQETIEVGECNAG
jgi:hypothetical protein